MMIAAALLFFLALGGAGFVLVSGDPATRKRINSVAKPGGGGRGGRSAARENGCVRAAGPNEGPPYA